MKARSEREWELAIDPDTVRLFVLRARAVLAEINDDYSAGNDHEIELDDQMRDNHHHDGLAEEEADDFTQEELRALIADLNVDEAAELVAMVWIGRGDYDVAEWQQAVDEARQRERAKTADYLLGQPQFAEWLEAGLEAVGA